MGHRIVIPASLRPSILNALHAAHQGIGAMCARAADSVFWPNITTDITCIREECTKCHRTANSNPMQHPCDITPPDYPFQRICADYLSFKNTESIVIVDRYSSWPIVQRSASGADSLIKRLREIFVTFGVLEGLTTDGRPRFMFMVGKTQEFLNS
ncbi:retrovirus-related pol polyprotein from [Plakobranchus ocellatus]|uniref:Retrovirus-related pol polyprotein from n=1 Tax=Plakobranchus ocellatus TaxID=259542 RepID=A0AAV4AYT7_9GAST|nr:retrovirus-related pol polyprotein from [Plakobranchus ocellatus]